MELVSLLLFLRLLPACPAEGWVTSDYGYRKDPITRVRRFHYGIDIANEAGTPIRSPWSGKVVRVSTSRYKGRFVTVQSGPYRLSFFHLQEVSVSKGDQVKSGDQVGSMGSSGRATGPHVHLEMRYNGKTRDPAITLLRCPELP